MKSAYWSPEAQRAAHSRYRGILDAWRTQHDEHRIATSEGETFVITAGRSDLPAVVLLPGSMATAAMWLGTVSALVESRFRVLAIDIIGDAGFSAPSRPWMRSEAYARWMDQILDALQIRSASLVGASLGGWISLDYAIRRPVRVRRLMLLAPGGIGRIRPAFMLKVAPLLYLGAWGHRRAMAFDMGPVGARSSEEAAFDDLFALVRSGFKARMQPLPVFSNRQLRALQIPVHAVVGGRDVIMDSRHIQKRVEANIRNSSVLSLPEAGHGLVNSTAMILEFLQRTEGS